MTRRAGGALALSLLVLSAACTRDRPPSDKSADRATTTTAAPAAAPPADASAAPVVDGALEPALDVPAQDRPRGGSARVGVWASPDPEAPTTGGAAVRALVLPQLFVARPDGRWSSSLAAPGSDRTADDQRSATLRLRPDAVWSDGTHIGADDLRRSVDARFVAGIDGPAPDGTITLRFVDRLPAWRRLWSGLDSVPPPRPGVWGGPFVVAVETPGLETVLIPNPRWWGGPGPFLDEVRMVLVPDFTTGRLLLGKGELDVLMPLAATVRGEQFGRIPGVTLHRAESGGFTVAIEANPKRLEVDERRALLASVDRAAFVRTLMKDEAVLLHGFAGPADATWSAVGPGDVSGLKDQTVDLVAFVEEPMSALLHRSMQKKVRSVGGTFELRAAESHRVEGWLRDKEFDAAIVVRPERLGRCWSCVWPDTEGAAAADTSDPAAVAAFQARLRDDAISLPVWRGRTVVASRPGLTGVTANGYAPSAAWNAWEWSRPPG